MCMSAKAVWTQNYTTMRLHHHIVWLAAWRLVAVSVLLQHLVAESSLGSTLTVTTFEEFEAALFDFRVGCRGEIFGWEVDCGINKAMDRKHIP